MGIMTVSGSSCQASFHISARLSPRKSSFRKPLTLVFKIDEGKNPNSSSQGTISMSMDAPKELKKSLRRIPKPSKTVKAVAIDEASPITTDLEYHEAAAQLENIYKLSPSHFSDRKDGNTPVQHQNQIRKKIHEHEKDKLDQDRIVVKNYRKTKRLDLNKRVLLKKRKERNITSFSNQVEKGESANRDVDKLVKEYSVSTDLYSWDWKKNKISPVLSSSEQSWLFGLMQPMKALNLVKEELVKDLDRGPTLDEVAIATNMTTKELRKHLNVGQAARNKLIKHNLRLVIFVLNKYFQDFTNRQRFQDLCQAGVKGLIVSIDRFEYKRGFQLSTYAPFWIRHAIMRSMTLSNFTRVPFGLESVRAEVQKVKTQLSFELDRLPTEEEILVKVGISSERYNDVMGASKPVFSLNAKHIITNEEIVKGIADFDGAGDANRRQTALFRLALDDVLDSLKPKENLVIRQRYGLDGKGDRTLSEIGGNLNISREMVRKHEMKALMKLKHPVRVDYLRKYLM